MRNVLGKGCTTNPKTCFVFSNVFLKMLPFLVNVEKYATAEQAT
jgi:hypothetical protein